MNWKTYDDFAGPELREDRWRPVEIESKPRLQPGARVEVADGTLTVDVERFTGGDEENQMLDNTKHLVLSAHRFELPEEGFAQFAVDLAVDHVAGDDGDYRLGTAGLIICDIVDTFMVLDMLAVKDRVHAVHEVLAVPGQDEHFTRVVDDPFVPTKTGGGFRECCVAIDKGDGRVVWSVDGRVVNEVRGIERLPDAIQLGFGFITLVPLGTPGGSVRGGGGRARWRNFRSSGVEKMADVLEAAA